MSPDHVSRGRRERQNQEEEANDEDKGERVCDESGGRLGRLFFEETEVRRECSKEREEEHPTQRSRVDLRFCGFVRATLSPI